MGVPFLNTLRRLFAGRQGPSLGSLLEMAARSLARDGAAETWKRVRSYWRTVGDARSTDDLDLRAGRDALFVSGCPGNPRRYRCQNPCEALREHGVDCDIVDHPLVDYAAVLGCFRVFVLHRVPWSNELEEFAGKARAAGKQVVFDTDDLDFDPDLAWQLDALRKKTDFGQELYRQAMADQKRAIGLVDRVVVSTPALERHIESRFPEKPCTVVRNAASRQLIELSDAVATRVGDSSPTVGYFSGTPTHDRDLATIAVPLTAAFEAVPGLRLLLVGPVRVPDQLADYRARIETRAVVPWTELPALLRRAHLHLAPLDDNPFTKAKSELKFFEAGLVGRPCIASASGAYCDCIRDHENGLLCENLGQWTNALIEAMSTPALLEALGAQARDDALSDYSMSVRIREWLAQPGISASASR